MEDSSGDYEEEPPGHPSSTSTPRHLLQPGQELQPPHQQGMHSASFLACSSALMEAQEDPSQEVCDSEQLLGTKPKPKRVLPFGKTVTSPSSRTPSFLPCKPSTDLVASLKSYFQVLGPNKEKLKFLFWYINMRDLLAGSCRTPALLQQEQKEAPAD